MPAPQACDRCPALVECRSKVVNGSGPRTADIAFVGASPTEVENKNGLPLTGKAGRVLRIMEWAVGINQHLSYYTYAARCFGDRAPKPDEIDNCHDYLMAELNELQPKVIVALGAEAIRTLYRPNVTVSAVAGFTLYNPELPGIPIIATYAPGYIMRRHWGEAALVLSHFRKAKRIAEQGWEEKFGSYIGVTTIEDVRSLRDMLLAPDVEQIAVDTETCGLSWMDDELLCVQFSPEPGIGFTVPILSRHEREVPKLTRAGKDTGKTKIEYYPGAFWNQDVSAEVIDIIQEILASDKPKSGQNIGFDIRMLERSVNEEVVTAGTAFGFEVNNVTDDSMLAAKMGSEAIPANLTLLTALHTEIPYYESGIKKFKKRMWELEDEKLWEYGGADVDAVQTVLPPLHATIEAEGTGWVYKNIAIPLIHCANELERRGVHIDQPYFKKLCAYYADQVEETKNKLNAFVGREVDKPSYYKTRQDLVFKEWKLPLTSTPIDSARKECERCRKMQAPCKAAHAKTGADELKELNERVSHEGLPILVDIGHLEKFQSTYMDGKDGEGGFAFHLRSDGRIHGRWNSGRAATGRFSCEYPNLMNPPKGVVIHEQERYGIHEDDAVRVMFDAPPGYGCINADWSQAELWVMAYETQDKTMLGLLESGADIHSYVSRELCKLGISPKFPKDAVDDGMELEEWRVVHKLIRDGGKVFVFGMNYGLTEAGAAQRLGSTPEEVAPLLGHYVQHIFPGMAPYFNRIRSEMYQGNTTRNKFGRLGHFQELPILGALKYRGDLEGVVRVGFNMPIQAGAHDLHSLAHIATERELSEFVEPTIEMHDSLFMYAKLKDLTDGALAVKELWEWTAKNTILEDGSKLGWEIPVDVQIGPSFGSLTSIK